MKYVLLQTLNFGNCKYFKTCAWKCCAFWRLIQFAKNTFSKGNKNCIQERTKVQKIMTLWQFDIMTHTYYKYLKFTYYWKSLPSVRSIFNYSFYNKKRAIGQTAKFRGQTLTSNLKWKYVILPINEICKVHTSSDYPSTCSNFKCCVLFVNCIQPLIVFLSLYYRQLSRAAAILETPTAVEWPWSHGSVQPARRTRKIPAANWCLEYR